MLGLLLLLACPPDPVPEESDPAPDTADGSVHDPLSMPAVPTLNPAAFNAAATCAECHPAHYDQWRTSNHAYAMKDPVFQALVGVRQVDLEAREDQFCTQCHSAIGTRGGECVSGFGFEELSPIVAEGVTCEACHKVSGLERTWNSGHTLDPGGPLRATLPDPVPGATHATETSELFGTAEFCGGCHDVIETSGLPLERPYAEWTASPAADEGRPCQDCHMATWDGEAATGAGPRTGLHEHGFVGVDVPLDPAFLSDPADVERVRSQVAALLASAASVSVVPPATVRPGTLADVYVTVSNDIDAHNLPTGSTFLRQLWIEIVVTDGAGDTVFVSGDLDADGDLRNHWSGLDPYGDEDLVTIGSGFIDDRGSPTLFPWRASEHLSTTLSPLYQRTYTYFVPVPADVVGPLTVAVRLRFRPFAPFLLRALGLEDLVERMDITDLDAVSAEVGIEPG